MFNKYVSKKNISALQFDKNNYKELKQFFYENNLHVRKTKDNTVVCDEWQEILYYGDYFFLNMNRIMCFNKSLFESLFVKREK